MSLHRGVQLYHKEATFRFDNDGFMEITADSEVKLMYQAIVKAVSTNNAIYLFTSSVRAYLIPVSTFGHTDEKERFQEFMRSKVYNYENVLD